MADRPMLLYELVEKISNINCLQKKSLDNFIASMPGDELQDLEQYANEYVGHLQARGYDLREIASSYSWMCREIIKEQIYFKKYGKYRYKSLDEVLEKVYNDQTYMRKYMIGVGISQVLWRNHHLMYRFWLNQLRNSQGQSYLEIGVGHGMFFKTALSLDTYRSYIGLDISPISLAMTADLINSCTNKAKAQMILQDALETDRYDEQADFVTMGEVLEHVEQPQLLINKVYKMLRKGGRAYISTCANAPVIDHIYLFNTIDEIRELLYAAGFTLLDDIAISNDNIPEDRWIPEKANISYAAIIQK